MDVDIEKPTLQSADSATNKPSVKKSRRGAGSRKKAAERYRSHKNETICKPYVESRINQFLLENAYMTEDIFGQLSMSVPIATPSLPIPITTHKLEEVAESTVRTLVTACKVPSNDVERDVETVQTVASLQLFAKIRYAQQNTPMTTFNHDEDTLAEQVVRNASQSILPIAVFIDQVGRVEADGQTFVPVEEPEEGLYHSYAYNRLRDDLVAGANQYRDLVTGETYPRDSLLFFDAVGSRGGEMAVFMISPEDLRHHGYIVGDDVNPQVLDNTIMLPPEFGRFVEVRPGRNLLPPGEAFRRYTDFLSRVQKKVSYEKLPQLKLERATGTLAQLAHAGEWRGDARDVRACRKIDGSALFVGASLELNIGNHPLNSERVCVVSGTVESRNAIPRMMQCLSQRVERK